MINELGKTSFNQLCNVLDCVKIEAFMTAASCMLLMPAPSIIALWQLTSPTQPLAPTSHILHSHTDCWPRCMPLGLVRLV